MRLTKHIKGPWQSSICSLQEPEGRLGWRQGKGPSFWPGSLYSQLSVEGADPKHCISAPGGGAWDTNRRCFLTLPAWWNLSHQR